MPQDPPVPGAANEHPDDCETKPLPQTPEGRGPEPETVPFEPVAAATEPIAPHVPIAQHVPIAKAGLPPVSSTPAGGIGKPKRRSPLVWIIIGLLVVVLAAIALAVGLPLLNPVAPVTTESPTPSPTPTETSTPTPTQEVPSETPTPTPEPTPTVVPLPEPTPTVTTTPPVSTTPVEPSE